MASQKALTRTAPSALARPTNPINALAERFPSERYNVLAPTTHMESLPVGTRIVVTEVAVNPDPDAKEVFRIAGGAALLIGKPKLDQIANAAGVSWLEEKRTDDRRHPHYVEYFVRGRITDFDGTTREITGTKAIDLRADAGDGIAGKDYEEIVTKAKNAKDYKTGKPSPRDPANQLLEARKFIAEIAASKAKNRAIASALGIKRSYSAEDLRRPFVVPKLVLDPQSAEANQLVLANLAGATQALYGARAAHVVDATFEEPTAGASLPAEGEAAGAGASTAQAAPAANTEPADELPPHDPATGEVIESPAVSIKASWLRFREAGGDAAGFRTLFKTATGKAESKGASAQDAASVTRAVDAFLANAEAGDANEDALPC